MLGSDREWPDVRISGRYRGAHGTARPVRASVTVMPALSRRSWRGQPWPGEIEGGSAIERHRRARPAPEQADLEPAYGASEPSAGGTAFRGRARLDHSADAPVHRPRSGTTVRFRPALVPRRPPIADHGVAEAPPTRL